MLNRKSTRSDKAQQDIAKAYPDADVQTIECDLQSFASVQSAADKLQVLYKDGIYALINNAGIMAMPDAATVDGFDTQMQTNHLSHFLLTRELFPLLEKGANSHGESTHHKPFKHGEKGVPTLESKYLERNGGNLGGDNFALNGGGRWVRYGQTNVCQCSIYSRFT